MQREDETLPRGGESRKVDAAGNQGSENQGSKKPVVHRAPLDDDRSVWSSSFRLFVIESLPKAYCISSVMVVFTQTLWIWRGERSESSECTVALQIQRVTVATSFLASRLANLVDGIVLQNSRYFGEDSISSELGVDA
ncbi:hypothetical protein U1Q18_026112 [Sarracenia purpurea var. burkii]